MKKSEKRDEKRGKSEFAEWLKVCRHFFPELMLMLNQMLDPRDRRYITYTQAVLISMCIMKNVSGTVTMRGMNEAFNEDAAIGNLAYMAQSEDLKEMPDWQTANNYLERLDPGEIEKIRRYMIRKLLRCRDFDRYKFSGCWLIIIDGTGYACFHERHCEHDLVTTIKNEETGKVTKLYYHKVLEAKIILAPGLVLSIDTEFIENEDENVEKQDCELRAAERLLSRIKESYPRLPVCILGDGLYATMPFMGLCREHGWHYILNLKDGRQKTLSEDFRIFADKDDYPNRLHNLCGIECGTGTYCNNMDAFSGKDEVCNIFEYRHTVTENGAAREVHFVWVTDIAITIKKLEDFIVTARKRWKIENEGFNNQKNGIYKIEHLCSRHPNAMKVHYLITQISDILMQLYIAFGAILKALKRPLKSVARNLGEYFWRILLTKEECLMIERRTALRIQT